MFRISLDSHRISSARRSQQAPRALRRIYLLTFLFGLASAITAYLQSSFIVQLWGQGSVGIVFTLSSSLTVGAILALSRPVLRWGKQRVFTVAVAALVSFLLLLALPLPALLATGAFFLYEMAYWIVFIGMDIALEQHSRDATTGSIRGAFLSVASLGWVLGPLASGTLADRWGIPTMFLISAATLIPFAALFPTVWKQSDDRVVRDRGRISTSLARVVNSSALWRVMAVAVALQLFYSMMVLYLPLYLHDGLGFSWTTIGAMFTVMLLPFVLFEYPAGVIADRWWGEKEMLIGAFLLIGVSTSIVGFTTSESALWWAALLFATRIGASVIESMRDSYFYKHADSGDVIIVDLFRVTGPLAYAIGPLVATVLLYWGEIANLFQVLGFGLLLIPFILLKLPDTR